MCVMAMAAAVVIVTLASLGYEWIVVVIVSCRCGGVVLNSIASSAKQRYQNTRQQTDRQSRNSCTQIHARLGLECLSSCWTENIFSKFPSLQIHASPKGQVSSMHALLTLNPLTLPLPLPLPSPTTLFKTSCGSVCCGTVE